MEINVLVCHYCIYFDPYLHLHLEIIILENCHFYNGSYLGTLEILLISACVTIQ